MKLPMIFRKKWSGDTAEAWELPDLPPLPGPERAASPAPKDVPALWELPDLPSARKRLVFAFDTTASREPTWDKAVPMTDALLAALPEQLEVALAAHGGGEIKLFTGFTTKISTLRDAAAGMVCQSGHTRLLDILKKAAAKKANQVLYVGDCCEESAFDASKIAGKLGRRGIRVIILQEGDDANARAIFADIAARTGGALLPFSTERFDEVIGLLQAVALLAVEGREGLEAKAEIEAMPGAVLLLQHLADPRKLLVGYPLPPSEGEL
jgi:hypothetical protein